jgi:hypothetical protein
MVKKIMKKILTIGLITIFILALSLTALADQAAYVTEMQAKKAAEFLKEKGKIKHFCAPCGDKESRLEVIETIEAVPTGYENYWEVKVNGKGIDLAYVYYEIKKGKWKNVAKELKIKVSDVPKIIRDDDN